MKRFAIFLFLTFTLQSINSQSFSKIIYLDFSATNRLDELSGSIKTILNNTDGNFILFVSNDRNPIITTDKQKALEEINKIYYLRPSKPDFFQEIDTLNDIMNLNLTSDMKLNDSLHFYFFLNAEQASLYQQDKFFIEQLMLTNKLLKTAGLVKNCYITIYFDSTKDHSQALYITQLKKKHLYEILEY